MVCCLLSNSVRSRGAISIQDEILAQEMELIMRDRRNQGQDVPDQGIAPELISGEQVNVELFFEEICSDSDSESDMEEAQKELEEQQKEFSCQNPVLPVEKKKISTIWAKGGKEQKTKKH